MSTDLKRYSGAYVAVIMKMLDSIDKNEYVTILGGKESFDFVCKRLRASKYISNGIYNQTGFYNIGTEKKTP